MRRGLGLLAAIAVAVTVACGGESDGRSAEPDPCRLPSPTGDVDRSLIPEVFRSEDEVEVTETERRRGRLVAGIITEGTIQSALEEYRELVRDSDYDVLQEDNEGFEAELYLQKGRGDLAVVQIRETGCTNRVLILLNLPTN